MNSKDYYSVLGVSKDSSIEEIKKSYKKLALKHHPDRGGNPETFKEINEAHDVLSDPQKKQRYDMGGDDLNFSDMFGMGGGGGGHSPFTPFMNSFFRSDMFHPNQQRQSHIRIERQINVTLKEAYNGCDKVIEVVIEDKCKACDTTCASCRGRGHIEKVITQKQGFTIFTQKQLVRCEVCNGSGTSKNRSNITSCDVCNGTKKIIVKNKFKVSLPKRTFHNFTTNIKHPTLDNYIIQVNVNIDFPEHFTRQNNDLCYIKEVSILDCLLGTRFEIEHPSGESVVVDYTKKNETIRPCTCITMPGKGVHPNSNFLVKFEVKFPLRRNILEADDQQQAFNNFKENYIKFFNM